MTAAIEIRVLRKGFDFQVDLLRWYAVRRNSPNALNGRRSHGAR